MVTAKLRTFNFKDRNISIKFIESLLNRIMYVVQLIELPYLRLILEEELMENKVHQILRLLCENVNCLVT